MSGQDANGGFVLSFGAAGKKPSGRRLALQEQDDGPKREEVIGVGRAGGLQTAAGPSTAAPAQAIIPRQENTYRTGRTAYAPSYIPEAADKIDADGINKFETAAHDTAVAQQDVTYGLIQRKPTRHGDASNGAGPSAAPPQHRQHRQEPNEAEVLKQDLAALPPEASLESYEAMPVEAFGEALLRGMGWSEGRAIGRGKQEEVKAKELVRRPHRLGLGAQPAPAPSTHKKYIKPGESRNAQDMVYVDPSTGTVKATKPLDAALTQRKKEGVHVGKRMVVIVGRHSGLQCEVQEVLPAEEGRSQRALVRLLPSHEAASVRCSELGEVGERNEEKKESRKRGERGREREGGSGRDKEIDSKRRRDEERPEKKSRREIESEEGRPWLVSNIRVKIVDKRLQGGRLYLKKGVIVDVKTPTLCDIFVDGIEESVLDVRQSQVETSVPGTEGIAIKVVMGKHRGQVGRLLQRNIATGLAAVQLEGDLSVHKLSLDDISEYCGPTDM